MEEIEIEKLEQKYWVGETSIEEERLLRKYWSEHPAEAADEGIKDYMNALGQVKNIRLQQRFSFDAKPSQIPGILKWCGMAAALVIGISCAVIWFNHYRAQQDLRAMHNELEADLMSMSKMLNQAYSESLDLDRTSNLKAN